MYVYDRSAVAVIDFFIFCEEHGLYKTWPNAT